MAETEGRTLGRILLDLGRVNESDVARALEHQRRHGGYFGEALVALGLVTPDDIEWVLASQFDLPYIFPDPEAIDPDAAGLVSPDWALTHLTLPIMRVEDTLTVVVDSPLRSDAVEELARRTGCTLELALASPDRIRELIRQVYARATAREEERSRVCSLDEALSLAGRAGAHRFGISVRGSHAWFWYDDAGTVRRRPLDPRWERAMEDVAAPSVSGQVQGRSRAVFSTTVELDGRTIPTDVRYLADGTGREFLFRPVEGPDALHDRFTPPPPGVLTEVQLLARSGAARFVVTSEPRELAHQVLPWLPALFFDPSWRSIHIHGAGGEAPEGTFSLELPPDADRWAHDLETLRAFHFDVVTVDLSGHPGTWTATALDVASVVFILWGPDQDLGMARREGVRWRVHLARSEGDHMEWSLGPIED